MHYFELWHGSQRNASPIIGNQLDSSAVKIVLSPPPPPLQQVHTNSMKILNSILSSCDAEKDVLAWDTSLLCRPLSTS